MTKKDSSRSSIRQVREGGGGRSILIDSWGGLFFFLCCWFDWIVDLSGPPDGAGLLPDDLWGRAVGGTSCCSPARLNHGYLAVLTKWFMLSRG